ncbi:MULTISPECIES: ABC transporter ATP-binding protein [Microbacterium]|uniref:ABC transporter ATP-binding protein n=1 Tax=Microbacterium TaxID=33882 RepID=UPI000D64D16F|nr:MULTISPECIES: ABC transporter ATP-binding protein [Microbacterium]
MIRLLFDVLGDQHSRSLRRTVLLMALTSVAEGLALGMLVPLLRALLSDDPSQAIPWLIADAAAVALYGSLRFTSDLFGMRVGVGMLRGMYRRLAEQLVRLPLGWYRADRVGEVSAIVSRDLLQSLAVTAHLLAPFVRALVTPLTIVGVVLLVDWRLSAVALMTVPLVVIVQRWAARFNAGLDDERAERDREATGRIIEYLQAQPVLRAAGRSGERHLALDEELTGLEHLSRRRVFATVPDAMGSAVIVRAAFAALLTFAVYLSLGGRLEPAEAVALLVLAGTATEPLLSLTDTSAGLRSARGSLLRLRGILTSPPLAVPAHPMVPLRNDLELDAVTHAADGRLVIEDFTLQIPEGQRLAVVGPSGAGKSTLLTLIARFQDPDEGAVRIGGIDVREVAEDALMAQIAIVFQSVYLFDGTIEENIRVGRPDADEADVQAAARAAGLDEVIRRLPAGWDTPVGERGSELSGGERQRVSIARALLKDAPIVLLDEMTSALDPATDAALRASIETLIAGRTVVMVTHRVEDAGTAERVAFVEGGRLAAYGTHAQLMQGGGRYLEFWGAEVRA